jgi:hypothetical protein
MKYKGQTQDLYLAYVNEYLTVARCAADHEISQYSMLRIIKLWRK